MFYAILILVVALALFLIFRDDHDTSYNKGEKPTRSLRQISVQEAQDIVNEFEKDQLRGELKDPARRADAEKESMEEEEFDLSFLDRLEYCEDLEEATETFDVTGLQYYCDVHDRGRFVGVVKPEPSNVHDPRAQAVIRSDGKLIGYIPRSQLDLYEGFNEDNRVCPFVGEITVEARGWMRAEITVILPVSREFVTEEIELS